MGSINEELIYSSYSGLYLKPYIWRDTSAETFSTWLKLMAEMLTVVNENKPEWKLPPRDSINYLYIQPSHIPAINSLCNQFFWQGIDCKLF